MKKVFLSHSSGDKDFVEAVAVLLGKHNCIYDKFTFELGMQTIQEIFKNLEETDIFVYFISNNSLSSKWVKQELNRATELLQSDKHKLLQIFPIIIDETQHDDDRIADFLKKEYNLQRVDNSKLAYRKIVQQISKIEFDKDSNYGNVNDFFYGRDNEVGDFKKRIDNLFLPCLKSVVVSGVPGIGKKSYLKYALRQSGVVEKYYNPITIALSKYENIEDLIVLISDAGFGSYTLEEISEIKTIDEKIDILVELINKIQKYKEIIIIEDDECIIEVGGNVRYWFSKALEKSENGIAIVITSNYPIDRFAQKKYPSIFSVSLLELEMSDAVGFLRTYSKQQKIEFLREDLEYVKDCLSGYPLQIIFCVDLAKNESVDYVKENTYLISQMPDKISSNILEKCQTGHDSESFWGIIALVAKFDLTPIKLINRICKANPIYRDIIISLKKYSVCYTMGSANEYLKMNSFIRTFVTRNRPAIPNDIQNLLQEELNNFNQSLEKQENIDLWDLTEIRFFIKENLINGKTGLPDVFIYSTIVLQTIMELYHNQKYSETIKFIKDANSDNRFRFFDEPVINNIQRYLCLALSKNRDSDFEAEVQFFAEKKMWTEFFFLKGFNARCRGDYENAKTSLTRVLEFNKNHLAAKRELVIVYLSLQDYDAAFILAENNYVRNKDNLYALQAYFECLLEQKTLEKIHINMIEEMLVSIKNIHRINPTPIYYQLLAKYEFHINNSLESAMEYLDDGLEKHNNHMYLLRDKFDLYRRVKNISGMKETLKALENSTNDLKYKGIYITRKAILDLFERKSEQSVRMYLKVEGKFSDDTIENIINKAKS